MNHGSPDTPDASASSAPLPPPRVPDHELMRRIGRGAYGEVWLARSVTGAFRAVKIVHRASFDHDRPFEREFDGILRFEPISRRHDSQVDVLHVGRSSDCFYYVMELADDQATGGQIHPDTYAPHTLKSDLLLQGRLSFETCVRIGIALATALEHLHEHGLVHRDVKPSNIIFVNGLPKLADIGLVTGVDATRSHVGTEGFAAPEGAGTPQADLYSLGKVLYEASTGKDRQEFPELPTLLRELPDREGLIELNAVIAAACRHNPKDRYASAALMRADLELLQSGKSLARLHRTEQRLRFVQRAGALVTAIAAVIAGGWLWQARQTQTVKDLAEDRSRLAAERTALAEENRERVVRLNVANGIREMDRGDIATALVWFSDALALATNNPADAAIQQIRIQHLLAGHPRLLHVLPHPAGATAAEFSPEGERVATGCRDGLVRIWDIGRDEQPVAAFRMDGIIQRLRFTRGGERLWIEWHDPSVTVWGTALLDVATGAPSFAPVTDATCSELSPDDRWLAVARTNGRVSVIAIEAAVTVAEAAGHEARIEQIAFSSDSQQFLTAAQDGTVRRWSVSTGMPLGSPLCHDQPVARAMFGPDASRIASVTFSREANWRIQFQTWDAVRAMPLGAPISGVGERPILTFDRSGRRVLCGDREATVRIWDTDSHALLAPVLRPNSRVRCFEVSPDGLHVALGTDAGAVEVWNIETGLACRIRPRWSGPSSTRMDANC